MSFCAHYEQYGADALAWPGQGKNLKSFFFLSTLFSFFSAPKPPDPRNLAPRAFEPYHDLCMVCGCITFWTIVLDTFSYLTFLAMFPGRWPNLPESMWNFGWSAPSFTSPQSAVHPGQFCGSDPSYQQSQTQAQAQRCWINNSTINLSPTSTISNNSFLIIKSSSNRHRYHLRYNLHHQPKHQLHLNHRPLRCPHQVHQKHHSLPLRCCNKWRRPLKTAWPLWWKSLKRLHILLLHPFQNRHVPATIATYLHLLSHNLPIVQGDPAPSVVVQHHQRLTSGLCQFIAVLHDAGYHPVTVDNPHGTSHLHVIVTDLVIDATVADLSHWSRYPLSVGLNITNKIKTDLSTLKTCLPVHLSHVSHHIGNNLPPRKTTTIEDTVNKIHHNGKIGTTGANGSTPPATTNPPGHPGN